MKQEFHGKYHLEEIRKQTAREDYPPEFNWRNLFHKLCLEQFIKFFARQGGNKGPLKNLHIKLNALAPEITVLRVPVIVEHLRSKNYWLLVLLGKLKNLKVVKFHLDGTDISVQRDFFKFMQKGMAYNA